MDQQQSFSYLPPEILLNILSRIPIKTVFTCKCVCKSWLNLLETPEFARSHLSKSAPVLLIHRYPYTNNTKKRNIFNIFEFEDSLEVEPHEHHYKTVLELDIVKIFNLCDGSGTCIKGSANGLLFLRNLSTSHYVCNPITREYIRLPVLPEGIHQHFAMVPYGFGVSRLSNQYKSVRISLERVPDPNTRSGLRLQNSVWQVYTLGTKSWRSSPTPSEMLLDYDFSDIGMLLNGNLHWLARDLMGSRWISCFDLENEVFTKFPPPVAEPGEGGYYDLAIGVIKDHLCLCDNSSESEVTIYLMNDYGDDKKYWNKEYVISKSPPFPRWFDNVVYAVKAFGDGDVLMASEDFCFFGYSNKAKTTALVDMFNVDPFAYVEAILYTPSFISLKDYKTENAEVFEFLSGMS